jgi:hypothetical protein
MYITMWAGTPASLNLKLSLIPFRSAGRLAIVIVKRRSGTELGRCVRLMTWDLRLRRIVLAERNNGGAEVVEPVNLSESRRGAHLPEQASRGGKAVVEKYGTEHMSRLGRKGSRAVVKKYGLRFYSEIAARNKGVKKRRSETEAGS